MDVADAATAGTLPVTTDVPGPGVTAGAATLMRAAGVGLLPEDLTGGHFGTLRGTGWAETPDGAVTFLADVRQAPGEGPVGTLALAWPAASGLTVLAATGWPDHTSSGIDRLAPALHTEGPCALYDYHLPGRVLERRDHSTLRCTWQYDHAARRLTVEPNRGDLAGWRRADAAAVQGAFLLTTDPPPPGNPGDLAALLERRVSAPEDLRWSAALGGAAALGDAADGDPAEGVVEVRVPHQDGVGLGEEPLHETRVGAQRPPAQYGLQAGPRDVGIDEEAVALEGEPEARRAQPLQLQAGGEVGGTVAPVQGPLCVEVVASPGGGSLQGRPEAVVG